MEFEVLETEEFPDRPWEALRRFLQAPRRQMLAWADKTPATAGLVIFALVVVELAIAQRLAGGMGRGLSALGQVVAISIVLLVAEWALVRAASVVAMVAGKAGNPRLAMSYLHFGLAPLLLVLPVTVLCEAAGTPPAARTIVILLLGLKVLGLWREVVETGFKLNRLQSAAAFYLSAGAAVAVGLLIAYATAISKVSSALS